jgi:hypothetical protein
MLGMTKASVAVGCAVLLAGCGSTKIITVTNTVSQVRTVTVVRQARSRTITVTRTVPSKAPAAPASTTPKPLTDSGNGTEQIDLTVGTPSTIAWKCAGCSYFDMTGLATGDASDIAISSSASSGVSAIAPGHYPSVSIETDGSWAFEIKANS